MDILAEKSSVCPAAQMGLVAIDIYTMCLNFPVCTYSVVIDICWFCDVKTLPSNSSYKKRNSEIVATASWNFKLIKYNSFSQIKIILEYDLDFKGMNLRFQNYNNH